MAALAVVAALVAAAPARAESRSGSVAVSTVSSPGLTRELFNAGVNQNLFGAVVRLPATADGASYTLTRTSGVGQLDAWFYEDDHGSIGKNCSYMVDEAEGNYLDVNDPVEKGVICPDGEQAGWAIITLRTGANAGFTLTW
jgi:hypothetical protein